MNFQIPEDHSGELLVPPITDEDRAKIFGGNWGACWESDTTKRRIASK